MVLRTTMMTTMPSDGTSLENKPNAAVGPGSRIKAGPFGAGWESTEGCPSERRS